MLIRLKEVIKLTGKSRSSIYADGSFPQAIHIGARSVAWDEQEVLDWIAERKAQRTTRNGFATETLHGLAPKTRSPIAASRHS